MHSFYLAVALAASSVIGLPHPHNAARGIAARSNAAKYLQARSNIHAAAKRQYSSTESETTSIEQLFDDICTDLCEELVGDALISQAGGEATCFKECQLILGTELEEYLEELTTDSTYSNTYSNTYSSAHSSTHSSTPAKRQSPSANSDSDSLEEEIDAVCTDFCEALVGDDLISQAGGEATCLKECQIIAGSLIEQYLDDLTPDSTSSSTYSSTPAKRQTPSANSDSDSLEEDIDAGCTDFCEALVGDDLISQAGGEATCLKECQLISDTLIEQYLDESSYGSTPTKRQSPSANSDSDSIEEEIDAICTDLCEALVGDGLLSQAGGEATCFKECELIIGSQIEQYLDVPSYGSTPAYTTGSTTGPSYRTTSGYAATSAAVSSS